MSSPCDPAAPPPHPAVCASAPTAPAAHGTHPVRRPSAWPGILVLLLCATMWSLNGALIKLLDQAGVPAVTIASYRSLLGGLVFLPLALRRLGTLRRVSPAWPIASVLTFTLMTGTFVLANTLTAASSTIILQYTSPIWVFLLAPPLLGERPSRREGLVLLIAMAGIAVIFLGSPRSSLAALGIALLSGLGYGALTVTLRGLRAVSPFVVTACNALGSGLILLIPVLWHGRPWLTAHQWPLMLFMALAQFTLPYFLFSWALQRVEAHRAALILLLETVLNPLWTYMIVHEAPPAATLAGGPLILAGVAAWLLLAWRRERSRAA
jgi:drug/metabolite transporter, DME family